MRLPSLPAVVTNCEEVVPTQHLLLQHLLNLVPAGPHFLGGCSDLLAPEPHCGHVKCVLSGEAWIHVTPANLRLICLAFIWNWIASITTALEHPV